MNEIISESQTLTTLKKQWLSLKEDEPSLRIRNAAKTLNVSEWELVLTGLGDNVTQLDNRHGDLLQALEKVGSVMALSRNDQVVHEKHGIYTDFKVAGKGAMGICLGDIDLRVFFKQWKHALLVKEAVKDSVRQSIQFFDGTGTAVHKIYATDNTNMDAWNELINNHTTDNQDLNIEVEEAPLPTYPNDGKLKSEEVISKWEALKDVHHFHAMLNNLGISRQEALRLVGDKYALNVDVEVAEKALSLAQKRAVPVMIFVGNRGIVQIHSGMVNKLLRTGPWFNVLDPDFNLHFNTEETAEVWIVRRPTTEGIITSIEVYNANNDLILTLFGERKPGVPELEAWQLLVKDLEK